MNTILTRPASGPSSSEVVAAFRAGGLTPFPRSSAVEWLSPPSPAWRSRLPRVGNTSRRLGGGGHFAFGEKFLFGVVAGLSLLAVQYGLSTLLELVQHWDQFNAGIERLVH
jgi:hypothetical protein